MLSDVTTRKWILWYIYGFDGFCFLALRFERAGWRASTKKRGCRVKLFSKIYSFTFLNLSAGMECWLDGLPVIRMGQDPVNRIKRPEQICDVYRKLI
jgi:hypothetical protein